ncbi:MAG: 1-acylglycerol-3-phosphate O-acyltransferase [Claussenomyces sp. TS43310]|nr:MAG: 1-acylglycerol-3-phosphate O-acyltransferase [Claussenomyces sp. TS43310]
MYSIFSYLINLTYFSLALTVLLFMLASAYPIAGFFARLLASYLSLIVAATFGVFISISLRLVGYGRISQWATGRCFKYIMKYSTGITFLIEDPNDYLSTTRPAVFLGNHQSELDVLMLGHIFPKYCSVTAKSSLKRIPFLGWFMALSGSVFIDRKNHQSARDAMRGAAEEMKRDKQSVFMFPEGTRSYYSEPGLLPFKKGAFHLAVEGHVPIVPIVVANYSNILSLKNWTFRSGEILIKVLKPIDTTRLSSADVEDLTRNTREFMLKELVSITEKSKGAAVVMPAQSKKLL